MAVYFILEENDADWRIKIGRSRNPKARTRDLQTGNSRVLKLVGWIDGGSDVATEARLHAKYATYNVAHDGEAASREWFYLQPADILDDLADAGRFGFVARNADAFEIVGYDRDAVPEYVGVWDWGGPGDRRVLSVLRVLVRNAFSGSFLDVSLPRVRCADRFRRWWDCLLTSRFKRDAHETGLSAYPSLLGNLPICSRRARAAARFDLTPRIIASSVFSLHLRSSRSSSRKASSIVDGSFAMWRCAFRPVMSRFR